MFGRFLVLVGKQLGFWGKVWYGFKAYYILFQPRLFFVEKYKTYPLENLSNECAQIHVTKWMPENRAKSAFSLKYLKIQRTQG